MPCRLPEHVADKPFGLDERYSLGLRRMSVFAAAGESYQEASETLEELCGIKLSPNTIRDLCYHEAAKMQEWQETSPEVQQDFLDAPGVVEVTTDGTCVNTTEGAREVKVGIISKRPLGKGVLPEQWDERQLPRRWASVAFAAIEEKDRFRKHFTHWRRRLRLGSTGDISVLADGAAWIWDLMRSEFGKVWECLDGYHALEHLSDTGKVLYGAETAEYEHWQAETKRELLESGFEEIEKRLAELESMEWNASERESLRLLRGYLGSHRGRLGYRERLAEGRAVGSGQVEGACKNLIGKRLKQTWAKWLVPRLNRMAVICTIRYSHQWNAYWKYAT